MMSAIMIDDPAVEPRKLYCILSARALPYAQLAITSLLAQSMESLHLRLITDEPSDRDGIIDALQRNGVSGKHRWSVHILVEGDDLAATRFAGLPHLRAFRHGHPCWRKITDPLLFAEPGEEMVILDPDLYFPNRFTFEATPASGLLLMWQPPSCLLPDETVMAAYDAGIALAHHVDIGVAHARNNMDLQWLDWLIGKLGGSNLPRMMHVEAIVWAALAMRIGGGYLDPEHWHCWRNSQWKRAALKAGIDGERLLGVERFERMKCFHGGGPAKWWVPGRIAKGKLPDVGRIDERRPPKPFEELTRARYETVQAIKRAAGRLGYYRLIKN